LSTPEAAHPYRRWAGPLAVTPAVFVVIFAILPTVVIARRVGSIGAVSDILANPSVHEALWFSLWQSLLSAIVCLALSLPITWVLSRFEFRGRKLVRALVTIPFLLPTVVVGVAFLAMLPDRLNYTAIAIILAHAYFNVAVIVRVVGARWESISTSLAPAAQTLGASPLRASTTITLAILRRSILTATSLVALFAFIVIGLYRDRALLDLAILPLFAVVVGQNAAGLALGNLCARAFGLGARARRAVVIEAGMQNSGLALGIIALQFGGDLGMVVIASLWGIWHIVTGLGLAFLWRRHDVRHGL